MNNLLISRIEFSQESPENIESRKGVAVYFPPSLMSLVVVSPSTPILADARNRGDIQSGRGFARGVGPPMAPPPNLDLVSFTSKLTSVFTDITSKFTTILGLDCM